MLSRREIAGVLLLSVDPGGCTGWAYWRSNRLVSCGVCAPEAFREIVPPEAFATSKVGVIELPMVYQRSKAPPKDIIRLAVRVGIITEKMLAGGIPEVIELCPTTWKGQVPKQIHHARIFAKLSPAEQEVVRKCGQGIAPSLRNNMLDAVGLGLYKVMGKKL